MLRKDRLNKVMERMECDQMLICDPYSIAYLTGKMLYPGERFLGMLIRREKEPLLYVNELFRFDEEIGVQKIYFCDTDDAAEMIGRDTNHTKALGVDKTLTAKFLLPMMNEAVASSFINGSPAVDHTRAVKDEEEIALMKEASRINDAAMAEFKELPKEGISELEIASQMMAIYKKLGAEDYSFDPIVAFGINAADPHHMPDGTRLKKGDTVLFDVGCRYHGYCSDMTRTFFFQEEPSEARKNIYNLVRKANEQAEAYVKPGRVLRDIDSAARDVITEGGYGKDFTHRLGHFIGTQDHEYGDVSQGFKDKTEPGNIFSIEPGIYHPAIQGCRIEDLVLVTEDGCEVLNHYPHDIEVIGVDRQH